MTTSPPSRPALGNGRRAIIPVPEQPSASAPESAEQAAKALAPFQTVPVPAGVVEAARHLIEPLRHSDDENKRASAVMVLDYLDAAIAKAAGATGA
ncbi:hypothetical protein ABZ769_27015 [Streptomyces olivoreticuli]